MNQEVKKKIIRKKIVFDTIAVFFIAITPFLYKIYDYLPQDDKEATISLLGLTIGSNGFADVSTFVWFLTIKIVPFILLIIWFFTSRDWWYHILLIPIAMYAFQLFEAFYDGDEYVDTENLLWLLPVCMVIIPFVYFVRVKLYDKYVHGIDLDAMDAELEYYRQKEHQKQERINRKVEANSPAEEVDTPEENTNKSFLQRFQQFQHSFKNLFNFFL